MRVKEALGVIETFYILIMVVDAQHRNPSKCTLTTGIYYCRQFVLQQGWFLKCNIFFKFSGLWRTQQRKTDAWRSMDFMPLIITHLYGPSYLWGSVLSTLQKLTRLIVTTILRCKSNRGPHFTDQEEKLLVDKTAQLKAATHDSAPGRLAPEPCSSTLCLAASLRDSEKPGPF